MTTRGGDYDLQVGQDLSIGYLSHDADSVQLYFQETLTFLVYTGEASVACSRRAEAPAGRRGEHLPVRASVRAASAGGAPSGSERRR